MDILYKYSYAKLASLSSLLKFVLSHLGPEFTLLPSYAMQLRTVPTSTNVIGESRATANNCPNVRS